MAAARKKVRYRTLFVGELIQFNKLNVENLIEMLIQNCIEQSNFMYFALIKYLRSNSHIHGW